MDGERRGQTGGGLSRRSRRKADRHTQSGAKGLPNLGDELGAMIRDNLKGYTMEPENM